MCIDDETPIEDASWLAGCLSLLGLVVVTALAVLGVAVASWWLM